MNLIVDIGNTRTKLTFFKGKEIVKVSIIENELINIQNLLELNSEIPLILSSVANFPKKLEFSSSQLHFDQKTKLPIESKYKSKTIGLDRLAAAAGAFDLYPNENCLIIDLGSAITIDFINENGQFEGGNISLGMAFRFKALHNFTSKLPLVNPNGPIELISNRTDEAIRSGVIKSILYEIEGYIRDYQKIYPEIRIILTGGDSNFFAKQLKKLIFANENLVAIGLNRILNYNVKKN